MTSLELAPDTGHLIPIRDLIAQQRYDAAEELLDQHLATAPNDAGSLACQAEIHMARQNRLAAAHCLAKAVLAAPTDHTYKKQFRRCAGSLDLKQPDDLLCAALLDCLACPELPSLVGCEPLWFSLLRLRPEFIRLFRSLTQRKFIFFPPAALALDRNLATLTDPLFQLGLHKIAICWLPFEQFVTAVRRGLLSALTSGNSKAVSSSSVLKLWAAIAAYTFRAGYIMDETADELLEIDRLAHLATSSPEQVTPTMLVALASYQGLAPLPNIAALVVQFQDDVIVTDVIAAQQRDALLVSQARARVLPLVAATDDKTSQAVRQQYEASPYPTWQHLEDFNYIFLPEERKLLTRSDVTALVAGCGTGMESSLLSRAFPHLPILAIDLSASSLAYALAKADQLSLTNINYRQADILKLSSLPETFDYIHSFGVLHHMQEPERGLENLVQRLKPGGILDLGLYSSRARRAVTSARQAVARYGYQPDLNNMRRFRKCCSRYLSRADYVSLVTWYDYFFLDMYRDLVFHAHEDQFDLPRVQSSLKAFGLEFAGFKLPPDILAQYQAMFPTDMSALNLDNWHQFEQRHPDTFAECYKFICRKPRAPEQASKSPT